MKSYRCPTTPVPYNDGSGETLAGCGAEFSAEPDHEGLVDCPECGMWFTDDKSFQALREDNDA